MNTSEIKPLASDGIYTEVAPLDIAKVAVFVKSICLVRFPFISKMKTPPTFKCFKEVTVRIEVGNVTRYGKPKPQRRRFDVVILAKPHYAAYGDELLSIGIEIKSSKSDLRRDIKYGDYLGFTNYFFFATPDFLVAEALKKAELPTVGVINITSGVVVKMPNYQDVSTENSEKILRQIAFNY